MAIIVSLGTIRTAMAGGTNVRTIVVIRSFELDVVGSTIIAFHHPVLTNPIAGATRMSVASF
jgi:hypothetical protein